ncbi:carbamoyl-phosphate synthase large subunit [Ruminococcus difficilis]|uniref:Carbamoyl phosphate synthase large chain n=1 Tax=Ruminococcus difficilis TaxID=2763069 RepID=A0A934TZB1_9FIRM|nr:carbamoyl-phosphate synthase large subunit [Ruminococcus difficilis]MBK6088271.1 carbamoyl-phosphate synthase large subunit [Ruminococcus difficilis]
MAKRTDVKKVLIIGSGPIVIGQAAEFDYAGTQACLALKEEGYEVILCNSNPATIMTDTQIADKVYMEPLTLEYIAKILRFERPDAIVPGIGGQTGLNLAMQLERKGILKECGVQLLGTSSESIERAEDRELFKEMCESIGEPVIPSQITYNLDEAKEAAKAVGYPVVLRPAFTLGGTGGGFADNEAELLEIGKQAFALSPVHQVLIEKSVKGYKEIEFEVMRDSNDTAITICGMENVDPVGVHTGDSIVVAPILSLNDKDLKMLNDSAIKIIRELKIEGGCNVQFALNPNSSEYYLIEVNPRVSRSSALASKASGYPIARVTAKIAMGMALEEIPVAGGTAAIEPSLDYIVAKFPRFPFDKFADAPNTLGTQMKATGEVMGIGSTLEECCLKSVRSLETGVCHFHLAKFDSFSDDELFDYIKEFKDDNVYAVFELLRRGTSIEKLHEITMITELFLESFKKIVDMEGTLKANKGDIETLKAAKIMGFSDEYISSLWDTPEVEIYNTRKANGITPIFKMVDTLHTGKYIAYLYSSYTGENASRLSDKKKIIVLGAGPIRIGQGVEFDYSTVHAVQTIRRAGYEAIIINNNPETVSTDYTTADKLYFEPLTPEDVMAIIDFEQPEGVIASLGGQTAINLAQPLMDRGVKIIGTDCAAIERAENRDSFNAIIKELGIPQPAGQAVTSIEEGVKAAAEIGYPVLVRPSFVLGGRAMQIVSKEEDLRHYLKTAVEIDEDKPVLVDKYIMGKEVEVDAICDGIDVFVPGIMELVERTGVHSGDSISVYPSFSISDKVKGIILQYAKKLGKAIGIIGLYNIQFIVDENDDVYIIEVNPRSSRTVPFLSKSTGYSLADIATEVILGKSLKEQGIFQLYPEEKKRYYVKVPVFSFQKIKGLDAYLSPEMKSTGEAIGYDKKLSRAMYKALVAAGTKVQNYGTVIVTLADEDKEEAVPLVRRFYNLGFNIEATDLTAKVMRENGIKTRKLGKISEGSTEILDAIRAGYVSYVINTRAIMSGVHYEDGTAIRQTAVENGVTIFTSLDTVRVLLDVLEETTLTISTIDA